MQKISYILIFFFLSISIFPQKLTGKKDQYIFGEISYFGFKPLFIFDKKFIEFPEHNPSVDMKKFISGKIKPGTFVKVINEDKFFKVKNPVPDEYDKKSSYNSVSIDLPANAEAFPVCFGGNFPFKSNYRILSFWQKEDYWEEYEEYKNLFEIISAELEYQGYDDFDFYYEKVNFKNDTLILASFKSKYDELIGLMKKSNNIWEPVFTWQSFGDNFGTFVDIDSDGNDEVVVTGLTHSAIYKIKDKKLEKFYSGLDAYIEKHKNNYN